jgi:hypothetical protein
VLWINTLCILVRCYTTSSMRKALITAGVAISLTYASIALAWTAPTASPPNGNVPAPLNTGSAEQVKSGSLTNIQLTSGTAPSPVTNKLYNVGGTLYFNGSPVAGGSGSTVSGSGTANYVSKFTGASTLGNSQIYDDGSVVGINSIPGAAYKFQVNATGKTWAGHFTGAEYGIYADSSLSNAQAVRGVAPSGYGGYFTGTYGTYASGSNSSYGYIGHPSYGGFFSGPYGLYAQNQVGYYTYLDNSSWGVLTNGNIYASDVYLAPYNRWLSSVGGGGGSGYWTSWAATGCGSMSLLSCNAGYAITQIQWSSTYTGNCNGTAWVSIQVYCETK